MRVIYDHDDGVTGMCALFECEEQDLQISGHYDIPWARLDYDVLTIVLCSIVGGLLIPDR